MSSGLGRLDVAIKSVDGEGEHGGFEAVLSAPTLDRDGEIVAPKAFEPLPPRIPIDHDHGMSVLTTVGSGVPFYEGDVLKIRGTFASTPTAQEVRALVREGHIDRMSVAFMNPKREVKDGVPHVVSAELLNAGIVCIPSNREAAITAAKRGPAATGKVGARNSGKDAERLQQIHDLAVDNGAECATKTVARPAGLKAYKSVAGSFEHRVELLRAAIRQQHPDAYWVSILATFDDSVVYELDGWDTDAARYQASYSVADDVVTLGSPEAVEVTEVVSPAKAGADEPSPEKEAAAPAAASSPASSASVLAARAFADELEVFLT